MSGASSAAGVHREHAHCGHQAIWECVLLGGHPGAQHQTQIHAGRFCPAGSLHINTESHQSAIVHGLLLGPATTLSTALGKARQAPAA